MHKFNSNQVFFTSDTHFCHDKIIEYVNRPFSSTEEMNETLIGNWNKKVGKDDIVFHLGDFLFGGSNAMQNVCSRLNGKIYLIFGNHDLRNWRKSYIKYFEEANFEMYIDVSGQPIYLNHFPFLCWPDKEGGAWQLFGHVHSGPNNNCQNGDIERLVHLTPHQYDVGVDNNKFTPISFLEIRDIFEKRGSTRF